MVFFILGLLKKYSLCSLWLHCCFHIRKKLLLYPHTHYRTALVAFFQAGTPRWHIPSHMTDFKQPEAVYLIKTTEQLKYSQFFCFFSMCWLKVCGYKISQIITGQVNNDHSCQLDILYVVWLQEDVVALIQRTRARIYPKFNSTTVSQAGNLRSSSTWDAILRSSGANLKKMKIYKGLKF